jgi:Mn2+/Fe2+ NRAMP family transporter
VPGLGHFLTVLIAAGGLAFNVGNVAGTGLGLEVVTGLPASWGAALSTIVAAVLFLSPDMGKAMDWFARILGMLMILLTAWVAVAAHPPIGAMAYRSVFPESISWTAVLTLVGGTVGGYITFAGAHRLLEGGISGKESIQFVTRSAFTGIGITALMRVLLFTAAFGVVASGAVLDPANPPASMFRSAAGELGYRFFGLVMWSAAITSVVGATFTSLSFLTGSFPVFARHRRMAILVFLVLSLGIFLTFGKPVQTLIVVGALNGLILPVALGAMLLVARNPSRTGGYQLPVLWQAAGWLVVAILSAMAGKAMWEMFG